MATRELQVVITGDASDIRRALGDLSGDLDRSGRATEANSTKWGKWANAARIGAQVGVAALVAFGAAVVTSGAQFEQQMSAVEAVSNATGAEMEALRGKALQLGADTSFSATQSASAMEELVKAGLRVEEVLGGAADATVALAAAGGIELADAATIAANALNAFDLAASDMPRIADVIAGAANTSAIDVSEFGMSMQQASAVANLVGLSFEDTATAIGLLGDAGIRGSDAGTSLKTMLTRLTPQTITQAAAMRELGLLTEEGTSRFYDQAGSLRDLDEVAAILGQSLAGLTSEQTQQALYDIFGSDALRAGAVLFAEGATGVRDFASAMGDISAAEVAETRLDNLLGSVERFKGSVESFLIDTSGGLNQGLRQVVDLGTEAVEWMADPPAGLIDWASDTGGAIRGETLPAIEDLVETGENLWKLAGNLARDLQPAGEAIAGLGGGAAAAGLRTTADALEETTGFLADHEEILIAVAGAYVGMQIGAAVMTGLASGATAIFALDTAVRTFTANLWLMRSAAATSGGSLAVMPALFGAVRTSVGNVSSAIMGSPLLAGGALVLGLYAITTATTNARSQADELVDSLVDFDGALDTEGMERSLRRVTGELRTQMDEWHTYDGVGGILQGAFELLTPFENKVYDNAKAVEGLREEEERLASAMAKIEERSYTMASTLGIPIEQVQSFMEALELDPETMSLDEMQTAIVEAASAASMGSPQTETLAASYGTLSDQASSATDQLSAYKDMVDAIFGVQMSSFEAQTTYGANFDALTASIYEHGRTLDADTEAGRANRDALQAAADAALGWSETLANEGNFTGASDTLALLREDLIGMTTEMLGSRTAAEEFVSAIGLTEENLAALATGVEQPTAALSDLEEYLSGFGGELPVTAGVMVDPADAYSTMSTFADDLAVWASEQDPTVVARLDRNNAVGSMETLERLFYQYSEMNPMAEAWLDTQPAEVRQAAMIDWLRRWDLARPIAEPAINIDESSATGAQRRLDAFEAQRLTIYADLRVVGGGGGAVTGAGAGVARWGGVWEFAQGGSTEALALGPGPALYMWREPETGGEAFIPKHGNRQRSLEVMAHVAEWLDVGIVDKKNAVGMARGGVAGPRGPRVVAAAPATLDLDYDRLGESVARALERHPIDVSIDGRSVATATYRHTAALAEKDRKGRR